MDPVLADGRSAYRELQHNKELWDLYTLKSEYSRSEPDTFRSVYRSGHNSGILAPSVSELFVKNGLKAEYPDNKKFAVCLTHDIDDIYPTAPHVFFSGISCLKKLNFQGMRQQLAWKYRGKEFSPYRNFKEIMRLEASYGARSSFYFMATDRDIRPIRPFRQYKIEDLEDELGAIADEGWEVGLHGGYYAFNVAEELKKEKNRLEKVFGKKVIGYRNHFLRFKVPDTWEILADAGFKYDTTLGYSNIVGFRNGMCHPFRPYDLNRGKEIGIVEIPLAIMEGTLFDHYRSPAEIWSTAKNLIDTVEKYNGVATLLWHNNMFSSPHREEIRKLYVKLLEYCKSKNAWMTSGEEVYQLWEKNNPALF